MKTTIYELLGMIKDNKAPKKIMYDNQIWKYNERDGYAYDGTYWKSKEYKNIENGDNLFDEYVITDILNDEVEILETTLNIGNMNINSRSIPFDGDQKIEKLETTLNIEDMNITTNKIGKINIDIFDDNEITNINKMKHLAIRINEIIDKLNKEE